MKIIYLMCVLLLTFGHTECGTIKKAPAFSIPKYSDSYIPAVMQVIFNGVEQYKNQQLEETEQTTTIPTTIPHSPGQQQPTPSSDGTTLSETTVSTSSNSYEKSEISAETPETIYGTPETMHVTPEEIYEMHEINQELPQIIDNSNNDASNSNFNNQTKASNLQLDFSSSKKNEKIETQNDKQSNIDRVVQEIYQIMKQNIIKKLANDSSNVEETDKSEQNEENNENEDENNENRFTLLGEKVTQVPRPSLSTYLKRAKLPSNCSTLQHLALLYDSLSKDARKQGFAQYDGYSDNVLKILEISAEGGMGPQMKKLLTIIVERDEITRADTKSKVAETLEYLKDPNSEFNRDLRLLLPLRFTS